jgi:hypothetical protein
MKSRREIGCRTILSLIALALSLSSAASADDMTGRFGAGGTIGPSFLIGSDGVKNGDNDVGLGGGGWIGYGFSRHWSARVGYDNFDPPCSGAQPLAAPAASGGSSNSHEVSVETVQFWAGYALAPDSPWNPSVRAGVGPAWVHGVPTHDRTTRFGVSAGLALERFVARSVTVGAALDWVGVIGQGDRDVHMLRPGLTAGYWFGRAR